MKHIPLKFIKAITEESDKPVRIGEILGRQNVVKDNRKSYTVQVGSSTLVFFNSNQAPVSENYKKQIVDQLRKMEQQKMLYNQLFTEEVLEDSKNTLNKIRGGGELGKGSSPGARARNDARKTIPNKPGGSSFAQAWSSNPSKRSRPAAANRLAQQFQPGQPEGGKGLFGRFSPRPTLDPSNPGCAGGPRSITVLGQSKSSEQDFVRELTAHDGVKARLTDKSIKHLTAKHGDVLGIDDPLPSNPNQKPSKYNQIRTRVNKKNKEKFVDIVEEIIKDPTTQSYYDVRIRGIKGHGYYTENYGQFGLFVGIHTEGQFAGQIKKVQPLTDQQFDILEKQNRMD